MLYSIYPNKGFAVLTTVLLLCMASIAISASLAGTQLIDNQVVGNYYRNQEAFINAESGINAMLSKIDESTSMLSTLSVTSSPIIYHPAGRHYRVKVSRINKNRVEISALGRSLDGSAQHEIHLQVYHEITYRIPKAAISSNGKLNLDATATVNEGCEGVSAEHCHSPGNIAKYQLVTAAVNEKQETETCSGALVGANKIEQRALYNSDRADNNFLLIGEQKNSVDQFGELVTETVAWPNDLPAASSFYDLAVDPDLSPSTLFESTFGVSRELAIEALQASFEVASIDMNDGVDFSCAQRLQVISDEVATIYIKGDCDIARNDAAKSMSSEHNHFTIGTVDHPKMVFIEGGRFITAANTNASVIGMLYFLPGKSNSLDVDGKPIHDPNKDENPLQTEMQSVDLSGIRVNGALLSDYNCSHNGGDKNESHGTKQHFSVRYDKTVLNKLYELLHSVPLDSGYRFVEGSWRDF